MAFGPGPHHDGRDYYSPAECQRLVTNFRRLAGHTTPRATVEGSKVGAALGHDPRQLIANRLRQSMGFLSMGDVADVRDVPGFPGYVEVDVRGVPTRAVGGEVNAGRLNGSSVELIPHVLDPDDPGKKIDGPILTGIAFLGEEQPAVRDWPPELRARAKPVATFEDGTRVPANPEPPPEWTDAMSAVSGQLAHEHGGTFDPATNTARIGGRSYSAAALCFSAAVPAPDEPPPAPEASPAMPLTDEQKAALAAAGFTPEQIDAMGAAGLTPEQITKLTASAPAATTPVDVPPPPDDGKGKMADEPVTMAALAKRMGALEAEREAERKKGHDAKMAEFSAHVSRVIEPVYRKVIPDVIEHVHKPTLLGILATAKFSAEADRVKAFDAYLGRLLALPDDKSLVAKVRDGTATGAAQSKAEAARTNHVLASMVMRGGMLDRVAPALTKPYRDPAPATA